MIGDISPAEWIVTVDPESGRRLAQLTSTQGNSYPLYYFVRSQTADGRYLIFHSERSGWVQLYRLDLETGEIGQLTDGRTEDSGWAIWCQWHLRGIYNHLSALNLAKNEVYYFQDNEIRATGVETFENRLLAHLPQGRMPVSQSAVSPNGSLLAFIHVETDRFMARMRERAYRESMRLFSWSRDHDAFRNTIPATLTVVDTSSGAMTTVAETDFYFHHVLFLDDRTLLLNHPRDCAGIWTVDLRSNSIDRIRPADASGAHNAEIVHQVVTDRGIVYEAVSGRYDGPVRNFLGRYDPIDRRFEEAELPVDGYVHTGFDPAGRFMLIEHAGKRHELLAVHGDLGRGAPLELRTLRTLRSPISDEQRHHAHPFLSNDRRTLFFTDWCERGFGQIHSLDIENLTR
jgi:hypothetical protein